MLKILPTPEPSTATGHVTDVDLQRIAGKKLPIMRQAFNRDAGANPRADSLGLLITDILRKAPQSTTEDVLNALKRDARRDIDTRVVDTVTSEIIEWTGDDGRCYDTSISALRHRIKRARKLL